MVPPFDPNGTRYDSTTYAGRLRNILSAINPATLLLSDDEVAASQARLRAFKENGNVLARLRGLQANPSRLCPRYSVPQRNTAANRAAFQAARRRRRRWGV